MFRGYPEISAVNCRFVVTPTARSKSAKVEASKELVKFRNGRYGSHVLHE